ncbi:hypothetical protein, partial [Klebsiella pneumoniae]
QRELPSLRDGPRPENHISYSIQKEIRHKTGAGFMTDFLLNAVTNVVLRSGPVAKRWELSLVLPNRRDRQVAARAGILRSLSTGQAMNRLFVYRIY